MQGTNVLADAQAALSQPCGYLYFLADSRKVKLKSSCAVLPPQPKKVSATDRWAGSIETGASCKGH